MARLPDILASVLARNSSPLPKAFRVMVNQRGTVTVNRVDPIVPASAYLPFFPSFWEAVNKSFPVGDNQWTAFSLPPTDVQLIIHSLPLAYLPQDPEALLPALQDSVFYSTGASLLSPRFLNPDPSSRIGKTATSVEVTIRMDDVALFGPSILLFSRNRKVEKASNTNKHSQCPRCWQYGHLTARCNAPSPVCPLCSLPHPRSHHRCPNQACPKGGNLKPIPACCEASPLKCPNCLERHMAKDPNCPARPQKTPSLPEGDVDMEQDEPPTRPALGPPFDPTTPKAPHPTRTVPDPPTSTSRGRLPPDSLHVSPTPSMGRTPAPDPN